MPSKLYGYARVSTKEQHEDRQVDALKEYGVCERDIIIDKESGKDIKRVGYLSLKENLLRSGDTLIIKELDRLSRNKADIKCELEQLRNIGVRVKILDIPTTLVEFAEGQEWVLDMVNNILIEVLGSIAEEERLKINRRQREGIASAHQRGVKFGRPKASIPEGWYSVIKRVEDGEIRSVDAMRELNIKKTTYYNLLKLFPLLG